MKSLMKFIAFLFMLPFICLLLMMMLAMINVMMLSKM